MNIVAQQFAQQPTHQAFLKKFLEHLAEYFRKHKSHLSEEKAYQKLGQMTDKIGSYFPELFILENICTKTISTIKIKIDDKFEIQKNNEENISEESELDSMMKQFTRKSSMQLQVKQNTRRKINQQWLRKLLIDELQSLKDDFKENQQKVKQQIQSIIGNNMNNQNTLNCLLMDSSLKDEDVFEKIKAEVKQNKFYNLKIKIISTDSNNNKGFERVNIKKASQQVRKSDVVFISAESIMKNGGVLAPSGALMVALAAQIYQKPIYVISRGFCLTYKIVLGQGNLNLHENPLKYFQNGQRNLDKIYIAKKYDYLDSQIVKNIITEFGVSNSTCIQTIFEQYYENI